MEAAPQYDVHEVSAHFSEILELVAAGEEVIISKAGEPVAKVIPPKGKVRRTARGSLRGRITVADDVDELPEGRGEAFGAAE
ncbi:type II toxin-antitoxin system prevent-host-death family antitoxin [Streptomyces sp. CC208A]|uniref:type II toxin-antitoxin system Phd/YefM family antitoxin n=1 Tax=Streptomyces sp. CC208A TaxID=3044573 RepID=UPI0024A921BD|nr:type II toxin-antitoxin system prevent-host-death family antitoxin [Streptomyces sp. CC208A]